MTHALCKMFYVWYKLKGLFVHLKEQISHFWVNLIEFRVLKRNTVGTVAILYIQNSYNNLDLDFRLRPGPVGQPKALSPY